VRTSCHDHHSAIFGPPQVEPLLPGEAEGGQVDRRGLHRLGCTFPLLDRLPPLGGVLLSLLNTTTFTPWQSFCDVCQMRSLPSLQQCPCSIVHSMAWQNLSCAVIHACLDGGWISGGEAHSWKKHKVATSIIPGFRLLYSWKDEKMLPSLMSTIQSLSMCAIPPDIQVCHYTWQVLPGLLPQHWVQDFFIDITI